MIVLAGSGILRVDGEEIDLRPAASCASTRKRRAFPSQAPRD